MPHTVLPPSSATCTPSPLAADVRAFPSVATTKPGASITTRTASPGWMDGGSFAWLRRIGSPAVIGRVYFSKSGKTLYYKGLKFQSLKGSGSKANYFETASGDHYWISGPRKDRDNRLYGGNRGVFVDDDVREEYQQLIG